MKLAVVTLCVDCDEVYSWREHRSCPSCGSRVSMHLSRLIKPMSATPTEEAEVDPCYTDRHSMRSDDA